MLGARAVIIACILASAAVATAASPRLYIYESKTAATTEGDAMLATDPDTAFRIAIDYALWTQIFPDVTQAIVTSQHGADTRVTFVHHDGSRDQMHFRSQPATRTLWFEQIGGDAEVHGVIAFLAGDSPATTHVHSQLYADVHGMASLFVSGGEIRAMREKQMRDDLTSLQAFFAQNGVAFRR